MKTYIDLSIDLFRNNINSNNSNKRKNKQTNTLTTLKQHLNKRSIET